MAETCNTRADPERSDRCYSAYRADTGRKKKAQPAIGRLITFILTDAYVPG